jgi:hypothetical protein
MFVPLRDPDDTFPADLVSADEAIEFVIDAVMLGSKPLQKFTKKVLKAQERLRNAVDDDGWKKYLKLEEVVNERASMQMELLVRWALAHGSRSRR